MEAGTGHELEQIVEDAVLNRLVDQVRMAMRSEDDHWRSRVAHDLARGGKAVQAGHLDIHQNHIGQGAAADLDRMMSVIDDGHDIVTERLEAWPARKASRDRLLRHRRSAPL